MTIVLNSEQKQFLQEKLKNGKYQTVDEVIVETFRLLKERDQYDQKWLQETRKKVVIGIEQLDKREGIEGEIVINQLKEKIG